MSTAAPRLTLRQLQIFTAVARRGSTAGASLDVALSQSATSSAINELERVLGLRLFDRAGKRLLLNDNGRTLLPRAQSVLDGALAFEEAARGGTEQVQALRIGASTTIGNYVLPALLGRFLDGGQRRADGWRSSVAIGNTATICEAVAAFELDVGLIEGPCHETTLIARPWIQDELVIVAAPHSALIASGPASAVALRALRAAVWLVRESGSGTREATDLALLPHLHGYARLIELASTEAIKHAAAEDLGITCLSRWAVADWLEAGRLVEVPTRLPRLRRQCYLVTHRDKQPTAALTAFVGRARAHAG